MTKLQNVIKEKRREILSVAGTGSGNGKQAGKQPSGKKKTYHKNHYYRVFLFRRDTGKFIFIFHLFEEKVCC